MKIDLVDFDITKVTALDGKSIPCNYLSHKRFDKHCGLCAGLHYLFIKFVADRSYSKGYEIRKAINCFLDYTADYEALNPKELHLTVFEDFTSEHLIGFQLYGFKNKLSKGIATRLKSSIYKVREQFGELPPLNLPVLTEPGSDSHFPLSDPGFNSLTQAFESNVDRLYETLELRKNINTIKAYTLEELNEVVISGGVNAYFKWIPNPKRVLKTLLDHKWPFEIEHSEVLKFRKEAASYNNPKSFPKNVLLLLLLRYNSGYIAQCKYYKREGTILNLDDVLSLYFPINSDQACLALFIMLQTGWNKETVFALDYEHFIDDLSGTIDTENIFISSEKEKSQSKNLPYFNPKRFSALSNQNDKYSAFNLINLAKNLSAPFEVLSLDNPEQDGKSHLSLFSCFRPWGTWVCSSPKSTKYPSRFYSLGNKSAWENGIKKFLENNIVMDQGVRLSKASDITQRLRPTWIKHQKKDKSLGVLAAQQGHKSKDTTDVHYDSSGVSMEDRYSRLRVELNEILDLLRKRKFKGLIGKRSELVNDKDEMRIFTIPPHSRSLWVCNNAKKPDWQGYERYITPGEKCSFIDKCIFCSQISITEDSLPFLIERLENLSEQAENYDIEKIGNDLEDEISIIESIIDNWNNPEDIKDALKYRRKHDHLLPNELRILSVIFED